jgi:hypothetical protein
MANDRIVKEIANMDIDIKNYIENTYGAILTPDQIADIVKIAVEWFHAHNYDLYNLLKIVLVLKQIIGKKSPVEEFKRALSLEGGVITVTGGKATLTVTHKDGSVDTR